MEKIEEIESIVHRRLRIFANGRWYGVHKKAKELYDKLIKELKEFYIHSFNFLNYKERILNLYTDGED